MTTDNVFRLDGSMAPTNTVRRAVTDVMRSPQRLGGAVIAVGFGIGSPVLAAPAFPPVIQLASLYPAGGGDGTRGFVLPGIDMFDSSGRYVSGAGDVNGDGIEDMIIGAPFGSPSGRFFAGESYVVFGSTDGFPPVFPLVSLFAPAGTEAVHGFVVTGVDINDGAGSSVNAAGDVNGDGVGDVVLSAYRSYAGGDPLAGETYVIFGSTQPLPAVLPLASLYPGGGGDGSRGFVMAGIRANDFAGFSVSGAGDLNGDGIGDLIIGANRASPGGKTEAGESYVVFGSRERFPAVFPLASLYPTGGGDGTQGFVLPGLVESDQSGYAVSAAGDVNGDGVDDVIICAAQAGAESASYVVFGSTVPFPAVFPLTTLLPSGGGDGSRGFVIRGASDIGDVRALSVAGDVNGDGIDDLILGAPGRSRDRFYAGASYVLFGATANEAVFLLESLYPEDGGDGSRGFVLAGIDAYDRAGWSVSAAGDVNGDGIDDVIIGARYADPNTHQSAGESYVVFGSTRRFPPIVPLATLYPDGGGDGSRGFVLTGIDAEDRSGRAVSGAGDVNGDGIDDVIIGAYQAAPGGDFVAGESYVVFGRASAR